MLRASLNSLRAGFDRLTPLLARFGYSSGLVVSALLHGLLVALMVVGWTPPEEPRKASRPSYIEAQLLQMEPAVTEPQSKAEEKAPQPEPEPRPEPEPEPESESVQQQQQREKEQKAEAERRRAEQKRREEQARREKERRERERREELERRKRLEEQAEAERQRRQKEQEQALARELAQEAEYLEAVEAEANAEQIGTYKGYMAGLIAANWSRPPSATRDMKVELEVLLGAAGRVNGVRVIESSGNQAFDRSAEQAVFKVKQFSRLQEMESALYQEHFRRVRLVFKPEDLRK